jgi:hypothetical protein
MTIRGVQDMLLRSVLGMCVAGAVALWAAPALGQERPKQDDKKPAAGQEMTPEQKAMMEAMAKAGAVTENHKRLDYMVGEWTFASKCWMEPGAPPTESTGTCTTTAIYGGRYVISEHAGDFMGQPFEGTACCGYDNTKGKYVTAWIDNMSTGIFTFEGTYDAATKTFTYTGEMDDCMSPGSKIRVREVIKVVDKDKHTFEWYETRGGKETKTMEMTYTRKK